MARKKKVLIVDDDWDLAVGISIRLRAAGYAVAVIETAGEVVGEVVGHKPDVVLLDLGLPDGDGLAVLNRLQAIVATAHVPVIVLTARSGAQEEQVLEAGAAAFFRKPADNESLLAAIHHATLQEVSIPR